MGQVLGAKKILGPGLVDRGGQDFQAAGDRVAAVFGPARSESNTVVMPGSRDLGVIGEHG